MENSVRVREFSIPYTAEDHERFKHAMRSRDILVSEAWLNADRHYRWLQKFEAIGMDLTEISPGKYLDASGIIEVTHNGHWRVTGKGNAHLRGWGMISLKKFAQSKTYANLIKGS